MKNLFGISLCFLIFGSCKSQSKFPIGSYAGNHSDCQFIYVFYPDKTFSLTIAGAHFSGEAKGDFFIKSDTLFIQSWSKDKQPSGNNPVLEKEMFLIEGDTSIVSLTLGYDYYKVIKKDDYYRKSQLRNVMDKKDEN